MSEWVSEWVCGTYTDDIAVNILFLNLLVVSNCNIILLISNGKIVKTSGILARIPANA